MRATHASPLLLLLACGFAFAQQETIWTTDLDAVTFDDHAGYGRGYVHANHPSDAAGGALGDGEFNVDGRDYRVWRITGDEDLSLVTLTLASGSPEATARLRGDENLFLRISVTFDTGPVTRDYQLSDARFTGGGGDEFDRGYVWRNASTTRCGGYRKIQRLPDAAANGGSG